MTYNVSSGVTSTGITLGFGDYLYVSSGGTVISTTVNSGGYEYEYGGTASFTVVNSGGGDEVGIGGEPSIHGTAVSTTVNDSGGQYVESGSIATFTTVNSGGIQVVYGASEYATLSGGSQDAELGGTTTGTVVDAGGEEGVAGTYRIGPDNYPGGTAINTTVNSGGTVLVASGGIAENTTVNNGGTEFLSANNDATGTTLNVGGAIDVSYLPYASGGSTSVTSTGLLTVSVGSGTYTQQLAGDYADERFVLSPDTGSGTLVTAESAPCYRSGTLILTDHGEVAVEDLLVGERVQTVLGESAAPIVWIGQRNVDCAGHAKPRKVWPVRVAAGAFGPGRPHTDLFLSPDHAVYVGEVLIPICHLINSSSIAQVQMERVTYYHIELPQHDVVLAQGLPAESFLDLKDGSNYANRPGPVRLYPDYTARMWEAFGCARLIVSGPELAAARALVDSFVLARTAA